MTTQGINASQQWNPHLQSHDLPLYLLSFFRMTSSFSLFLKYPTFVDYFYHYLCHHYHDKNGTFLMLFLWTFLQISDDQKFQHNILKTSLNDLYRNRDRGQGYSSSESPGHFSPLASSLCHIPFGDFHITPSVSKHVSE